MQFSTDTLTEEASSFLDTSLGLAVAGTTALVFGLAWCRIFSKAGFHGAVGLLMLVPGVNLIVFLYFAFGRWPAMKEMRSLRKLQKSVHKADKRHFARAS